MDANEHSVSFSMQTNVWLEVQARCRRQVQVIVDAKLALSTAYSQHLEPILGWKAFILYKLHGQEIRLDGAWRSSILCAVESVLEHDVVKMSPEDEQRVKAFARDQQAACTGSAQINFITATPAKWQGEQRRAVGYIHQIYGLFGDDRPMSPLFMRSHKAWQRVASSMGAKYHLWNAVEVETLMKNEYTEFWKMYRDVRYPIMRCDMARLAILHSYGGLYADLDILPNRQWYPEVHFALAKVSPIHSASGAEGSQQSKSSLRKGKSCGRGQLRAAQSRKKKLAAKSQRKLPKGPYYDMEVIIGSASNNVFLRWLRHMKQEIRLKDFNSHKSFWKIARIRYVHHTTGPHALKRFLKLNKDVHQSVRPVACNYFTQATSLSSKEKRRCEVISHQSNSYFCQAEHHKVYVEVCTTGSMETLMTRPTVSRSTTISYRLEDPYPHS